MAYALTPEKHPCLLEKLRTLFQRSQKEQKMGRKTTRIASKLSFRKQVTFSNRGSEPPSRRKVGGLIAMGYRPGGTSGKSGSDLFFPWTVGLDSKGFGWFPEQHASTLLGKRRKHDRKGT